MRRLLSQARFLTLLLPLYCIFACVQVGCGGKVLHNETSTEPVVGGPIIDEPPPCGGYGGFGGYGGYGGCDPYGGGDYGGYDDGYYGYP